MDLIFKKMFIYQSGPLVAVEFFLDGLNKEIQCSARLRTKQNKEQTAAAVCHYCHQGWGNKTVKEFYHSAKRACAMEKSVLWATCGQKCSATQGSSGKKYPAPIWQSTIWVEPHWKLTTFILRHSREGWRMSARQV